MHFFAVVRQGSNRQLRRVTVANPLQEDLTRLFTDQAAQFHDETLEQIPFNTTYSVDSTELFVIDGFALPPEFVSAVSFPFQFDELTLSGPMPPEIKSIFAAETKGHDGNVLYFQSFNKSRILVKKMTILHSKNTFHRMTDPGLTLDTKLAAVYEKNRLLFKSFSVISGFLDVNDYFREATNDEVLQVLDSTMFSVADKNQVLATADTWMRKRFSAAIASGILEHITASKCQRRGKKFGLQLETKKRGGKLRLVFPSDKRDQKKLLRLLTEGYFTGELTGKPFQSNSHRPLKIPMSIT